MKSMESHCVVWPPAKSSFLAALSQPAAQAMVKDIHMGRVSGMSYRVQGEQIYLKGKPRILYFIQIDGWEYTIRNESLEYPILSFSYLDRREHSDVREHSVQNIRILSRPMMRGYRLPDKIARAAMYMMKQIAKGIVPDAHRVLSSFQLVPAHPLTPGFIHESFQQANRNRPCD